MFLPCYVFDPGPDRSIGDVSSVINARKSGKQTFLVVHGALLTDLAKAADVVLPGASWIEKDATYVNMDGRLQASSRAMASPGEAQEGAGKSWRTWVFALGAAVAYPSSAEMQTAGRGGDGQPSNLQWTRFHHVRTAGFSAHVAADVEPVRALEVGLHVPGYAAGQIRGPSRVVVAARGNSDEGSQVRPRITRKHDWSHSHGCTLGVSPARVCASPFTIFTNASCVLTTSYPSRS